MRHADGKGRGEMVVGVESLCLDNITDGSLDTTQHINKAKDTTRM